MELLDKEDIKNVEEHKDEELLKKAASLYKQEDYESAIEYYRLAAALGSIIAISNLGYCYYYARGTMRDYTIARAYFELAARHGDINSIYILGDMYMNGEGVEQDEHKGVRHYVDAYNLLKSSGDVYNYPDVLLRLAKIFIEGRLLDRNLEMAANFLEVAREGFKERMDMEEDTAAEELYEEVESCLEEIKNMKE